MQIYVFFSKQPNFLANNFDIFIKMHKNAGKTAKKDKKRQKKTKKRKYDAKVKSNR